MSALSAEEKNIPIIISKDSIKRLVKDIKDLKKNPLNNEGIFYSHSEDDILKGYAYINGPKDSVYFGGHYFFELTFPYDYPARPPKVKFMSNDGKIRYHPNLYRSGKVCLSILNTWRGETWTSCQSIRSVLVTILSILDNDPLKHEPGYDNQPGHCLTYKKAIFYKNIEFNIYGSIKKKWIPSVFRDIFNDEINENNSKNFIDIMNILENNNTDKTITNYYNPVYRFEIKYDWKNLYNNFKKIEIKENK